MASTALAFGVAFKFTVMAMGWQAGRSSVLAGMSAHTQQCASSKKFYGVMASTPSSRGTYMR
jgi:hypothetical protein